MLPSPDPRVVEHWYYDWPDGRRTHGFNAGDRRIQISISPKGRSIRIWVDGEEVPK